jgi:hypothetical protein
VRKPEERGHKEEQYRKVSNIKMDLGDRGWSGVD